MELSTGRKELIMITDYELIRLLVYLDQRFLTAEKFFQSDQYKKANHEKKEFWNKTLDSLMSKMDKVGSEMYKRNLDDSLIVPIQEVFDSKYLTVYKHLSREAKEFIGESK